jgi:hypothetical protein
VRHVDLPSLRPNWLTPVLLAVSVTLSGGLALGFGIEWYEASVKIEQLEHALDGRFEAFQHPVPKGLLCPVGATAIVTKTVTVDDKVHGHWECESP